MAEDWSTSTSAKNLASLTKRHRKTRVATPAECETIDLHSKPTGRANTFRILQVCPELQEYLLWNSSEDGYSSAATGPNRFNKASRLSAKDLARLLRLGYIERIDAHDVKRLGVAFTIIEDKEAGPRRRFILWPEQLNTEVSVAFPSTCSFEKPVDVLADVHEGTAARCYDLRVGFWQLGLSKKVRAYHAFRVGTDYYAMSVMAMGACKSPEILHKLTESLGAVAIKRALKQRSTLKIASKTHIDNIRFVGTPSDVDLVGTIFEELCAWCNVSLNVEAENKTHTQGKFLGVHYDFERKTVCLTQKVVEKLRKALETTATDTTTAETLMSVHGLLQYASSILQAPLAQWYAALKYIRRCSSQLHAGTLLPASEIKLWKDARIQLTAWLKFCVANKPVTPVRSLEQCDATLFTDASLEGLGAVLIIAGNVFHFGRKWSPKEIEDNKTNGRSNISALELLAAEVGLQHFAPHIAEARLHLVLDSTTGIGALRKGCSKSELLNARVVDVTTALKMAKLKAAVVTYIVTSANPADLPSRNRFDEVAITRLARRFCDAKLWRHARPIPVVRPMVPTMAA
jgi:hypothetical protein